MNTRLLLVLLAVTALAETNWDAAGKKWWAHVRFLADDKLEGRNVGSAGYETAADYVIKQFEGAGLAASSQPVAFTKTTLDEARSRLVLVAQGPEPVRIGDQAVITSTTNVANLEAPLVFVGYGLDIPEANYSDLKGQGLKGAIAVYLAGGPSNVSGELRSHYSSGAERTSAMKAAGVVGTIAIPNPRSMDIPWSRQSANRLLPRMALADPAFSGSGLAFTATWNPDKADRLLNGSLAGILDAADHNRPLPHFPLMWRLQATVAVNQERVASRNVVGIRRGSDPALAKEYVILSAHLDHLGVGEKVNGDGIFNGAMDNASGVASLIEIARALKTEKVKTKRSIVFLAVTGEEKGELGSLYFADHPTFPGHPTIADHPSIADHPTESGRIVADINMDMFLPLFPLKYLEVQGLNESSLGDDIRAVASAAHVGVQADKDPSANRFIRSDQYSFIRKGIPALAFKFGWIPGSPEEKIYRDWYRDRYHGVADDVNQPVDLAAAAQFDSILAALLKRVADAQQAPRWGADSFFQRFVQ